MVIVLMGVCGCGKTTIGKHLARKTGLPFYDADDFHPPKNVAKMSSGTPLNDTDREPWLAALAEKIGEWNKTGGAVLACSALKQSYRHRLLAGGNQAFTKIVHLKGTKELISRRLKNRSGHYMPPALLDSQFAALEEPADAITVSIEPDPDVISNQILRELTIY